MLSVCVGMFACVCVCALHLCLVHTDSRRGSQTWTGVTDSCELKVGNQN